MKFSVIIPTKGRDACLRKTLEDFEYQTFRDFEVVVVDQNERPLENLEKSLPTSTLVHLMMPPLGSHAGRNLGIEKAKGEYCVFVDDDVRVPPKYLELLYETWESVDARVAVVAGRVIQPKDGLNEQEMLFSSKPATYNRWTGLVQGNFFGYEPTYIDHFHECNFSARTRVLNEVGSFNVSFKGNAYYEGVDLALRISEKNYKMYFNPKISITHLQDVSGGNREHNVPLHTYWKFRNNGLLNSKHMHRFALVNYSMISASYILLKSIKDKDARIAVKGFKGLIEGILFFVKK